jgi:hypothetical protein
MTGNRMHKYVLALCLAGLTAGLSAGCTAGSMAGRPAGPLQVQREEPGVILCASERTSGGVRLVGKLHEGAYPITNVQLQYRLAGFSDAPPTIAAGSTGLQLAEPRTTAATYRKGSKEVSYTVDAGHLRGKVLWYRWLVSYSGGVDATDIHRTSLDEAGLPRAAGTPGPDTSIALPVSRRR